MSKCPKCQLALRIIKSRNVIENDDTPDIPTKLFIEQDLACMNRNCENYSKVIETIKTEEPIG